MTWNKRTDLATEAKEIWQESAGETTQLKGVKAYDTESHGFLLTCVEILDDRGAKALRKPVGRYLTLEIDPLLHREKDGFSRSVFALRDMLQKVLSLEAHHSVLLVGLGNPDITPDAIGPIVAKNTLATKHLLEKAPEHFESFRSVSVLQTGVLGTTGVESAQMVSAFVKEFSPDCVIAVDALASRKFSRVCRTVQAANTGIVPGSGIGNARQGINQETLGVPVIALGVPTVVDAGTLALDLLEEAGSGGEVLEKLTDFGKDMIVTPKEIDSQVTSISKILAYGVNLALHDNLSLSDLEMLTG